MYFSSLIRATFPADLVPFDMITLILLGDEQKLWSFSLYNFLHLPINYCVSGENIFLIISFSYSQPVFSP